MKRVFTILSELEESGEDAALCTVVSTSGSTPRKPGARMVVREDGSIHGSIGGGTLEMQVIKEALNVIKKKSHPFRNTPWYMITACAAEVRCRSL